MTMRDVPPSEWRGFLEAFGREHRAWLATIHGIEQETPFTCIPSAALKSVRLENGHPDHVVRLTFVTGISLCAVRPCAVRVQQRHDGAVCALEVETVDGALVRLAFRATALPEQLDGVAPNELGAGMAT
jgi:hypothetical protein